MTRQKLNSFRSNQIEVSYLVLVSKSKEMCRKFPEIRSLSYFKRINGLEFWCLQIPLKVVTFWDEPKLAKSCPANFVPLKKFRVQNDEHVTHSQFRHFSEIFRENTRWCDKNRLLDSKAIEDSKKADAVWCCVKTLFPVKNNLKTNFNSDALEHTFAYWHVHLGQGSLSLAFFE